MIGHQVRHAFVCQQKTEIRGFEVSDSIVERFEPIHICNFELVSWIPERTELLQFVLPWVLHQRLRGSVSSCSRLNPVANMDSDSDYLTDDVNESSQQVAGARQSQPTRGFGERHLLELKSSLGNSTFLHLFDKFVFVPWVNCNCTVSS